MKVHSKTWESFADGNLTICECKDRKLIKTKHESIRFGKKTVGVTRFWQAQLAGNAVDRMVAVPMLHGINRMDVVLIDDEQYEIKQIQEKDTMPPTLYLSLSRLTIRYKDER